MATTVRRSRQAAGSAISTIHAPGKAATAKVSEVIARRPPVLLLARADLGQHVAAHRLGEEAALGGDADGDEPGRRREQHQGHAPERPQRPQPGRGAAVGDREGDPGEQRHHRPDRPLQQHARAEQQPERRGLLRGKGARPQIGGAEQPHGGGGRGEQRRVGLRDVRFHDQHQRGGEHGGAEKGGAPSDQRPAPMEGRQHGQDGAGKARHAVGPDVLAAAEARRLQELDGGGLQPVDAGRLLVALLLAEADAEVVAAFHHLPAGLGEAGLVAVGGREGKEAGQEQQQAEQREGCARAPLRRVQRGAERRPLRTGEGREVHAAPH